MPEENLTPQPLTEPPTEKPADNTVFKTEVVPEELPDEEVAPENLTIEREENSNFSPLSPEPKSNHRSAIILFILVGLFFVVSFLVILRIFGVGKTNSKNKVILEYWGLWEDEAVIEPIIADFERKNSAIDIKYTKRDPQNYREHLLTQSTDGKGPDIFRFHNTWVPMLSAILAPVPNNIVRQINFGKTFYPVVTKDLKVDKHYYGIPLEIDGLVLVYNKDLFKRAGLELAPKTWEDIIDYAQRLTVKDENGIVTSGIALGTANNIEHFSDILGFMLLQNGADINKLSAPEAVDTLQQYRRFAEPPHNTWDDNMPNSLNAFIQAKVAMIFVPSWQILTILQSNSDLDFAVSALPKISGVGDVGLSSYWVEGVSKKSKNQKEAWKFLQFLSDSENLTKLYSEQAKTRQFGEPYSRVDLRSKVIQNKYIGPVLEMAPKMKTLPLISRTIDNGINDEIIQYLVDSINATAQGVSYQEAFATAEKGVLQVMKKYKVQ